MTMSKKPFILLILLFSSKPIFAQVPEQFFAQKNKMSHSLNITGSTIILYYKAALHYELLEERKHVHTFIQAGGGLGYNLWYDEFDTFFFSRLGFLAGKRSHYFEGSAGAGWYSFAETILPTATVGYRNLDPGGHSMFRFGLGFPEFLYLGYGYRF